jgi:hypothetical protein
MIKQFISVFLGTLIAFCMVTHIDAKQCNQVKSQFDVSAELQNELIDYPIDYIGTGIC